MQSFLICIVLFSSPLSVGLFELASVLFSLPELLLPPVKADKAPNTKNTINHYSPFLNGVQSEQLNFLEFLYAPEKEKRVTIWGYGGASGPFLGWIIK